MSICSTPECRKLKGKLPPVGGAREGFLSGGEVICMHSFLLPFPNIANIVPGHMRE